MKLLRAISARIAIGFIAYDRKIGDLVSLRCRLDRFLKEYAEDYPFMLAFDGALLFAEGRNKEGQARFSECLDMLSGNESVDARYVKLFCRFSLNLRDRQVRNSAREEASQLKADSSIRWFLRFLSEERLMEVESEARQDVENAKKERNPSGISFDF